MKSTFFTFAAWIAAAGIPMVAAVGCADSNENDAGNDAGTNALPEAGSAPGEDGCNPDAGAASDACAPAAPTCADVDFCPVSTGPDPRYTLTGVWGTSKTDVWAVGSGGTILHWDGAAWAKTESGTKQAILTVGGSGPSDVLAGSSRGVVLHSTGFSSGAATWSILPELAPVYAPYEPQVWNESLVLSVWSSGDETWIGSEPYPVLLDPQSSATTQVDLFRRVAGKGGKTEWAYAVVAVGVAVRGLWGTNPDDVWAVGGLATTAVKRAGRALHTSGSVDGTPVWTEFDTQSSSDLNAVWGSAPDDVWAVGNLGTVRHWTGGATKRWEIVDAPTKNDLRAVWGSGPNDVWAVGDLGTILHFDGTAWTLATSLIPSSVQPTLRGVWGSGPNDVWVVGDSIALHFEGKVGAP